MKIWKREWTKEEAELWTKEDVIAASFVALSFVGIIIGTIYSFLLMPIGFITLALSVGIGILGILIILPKMQSISREYEKKQAKYLEDLEKIARWEEIDG